METTIFVPAAQSSPSSFSQVIPAERNKDIVAAAAAAVTSDSTVRREMTKCNVSRVSKPSNAVSHAVKHFRKFRQLFDRRVLQDPQLGGRNLL
jgi:hypothetical protein